MFSKIKKSKINLIIIFTIIFILILAFIFNNYIIDTDHTINNKELAIKECTKLCTIENAKDPIADDGPCLSNEVAAGWACDIAHNPRLSYIDNKKENQCSGDFKHFVELTKNCKFIRAQ
jgi:hypothetical protein